MWHAPVHTRSCRSSAAEWEGVLLALYREVGDSWNPTPGNKLYERETLLAKRMDEASSVVLLT